MAGIVLMLDGLAALLIGTFALYLSVFPPVAAIEGRPSPDQSQWGLAIASIGFAAAAAWAGLRALRGIRRGRVLGVVVVLAVAALLGWWMLLPGAASAALLILAALLAVHVVAAVVIARWPDAAQMDRLPA